MVLFIEKIQYTVDAYGKQWINTILGCQVLLAPIPRPLTAIGDNACLPIRKSFSCQFLQFKRRSKTNHFYLVS